MYVHALQKPIETHKSNHKQYKLELGRQEDLCPFHNPRSWDTSSTSPITLLTKLLMSDHDILLRLVCPCNKLITLGSSELSLSTASHIRFLFETG